MNPIRQIKQTKTEGDIFLHSMPGRFEKLPTFTAAAKELGISKIVCLTKKKEIRKKSQSSAYSSAVKARDLEGIPIIYSPVPDYAVPTRKRRLAAYRSAVQQASEQLKTGSILIHCGAGVGRTGTLAIVLLRVLGFSEEDATRMTLEARSEPEGDDQRNFCRDYQV
jgi:protein-tyrosine phosphatase